MFKHNILKQNIFQKLYLSFTQISQDNFPVIAGNILVFNWSEES